MISIGIIAMLLFMGLAVMPQELGGVTETASAETVTAAAANCGTELWRNDTGASTVDTLVAAGAYLSDVGAYYATYRSYIAMDCSGLDAASTSGIVLYINGANLDLCYGGGIDVYYRPTTMAAYANDTFYTDAEYVGRLCAVSEMSTYPSYSWYTVNLPTAALSTGDWSAEYGAAMDTVFYLVYSEESTGWVFDNYALFDDATNPPYVETVDIVNGECTVRYYFDATSYGDFSILPAERMEYNTTHDSFRYEVYILNYTSKGVQWIHLILDESIDFIMCNLIPSTYVDDLGGGVWNLTAYYGSPAEDWPSMYIMLWFSVPKAPATTEVNLAMWHSTLGEGFLWERFKVVVNTGTAYNNTTATWVPTPTTHLVSGATYTFTVMDYFGNLIDSRTAYVSGDVYDLLIPLGVWDVGFRSWLSDTVNYAIYFNATGTPYQGQLMGGEIMHMGIREGTYMFRFDRLITDNQTITTTVAATTFYNVTVNQSVGFNIGEDGIIQVSTLVGSTSIMVGTISLSLQPSVNYIISDGIYASESGTRSAGGVYVLDDEPFLITDATAEFSSYSTTGGSVWGGHVDESLMYGAWAWSSDFLSCSITNASATVLVNDTTLGTTLLSRTGLSVIHLDIYADNATSSGHNITVWVTPGTGITVIRSTTFRWARPITWNYVLADNEYYCYFTLNNSLNLTLRNPSFLVTYPEIQDPTTAIDLSTIELYDVDNFLVLSPTSNYTVYSTGVGFTRPTLDNSTQRNFRITFTTTNDVRSGTEYIAPAEEPYWFSYQNKDYMSITAEYSNPGPSAFVGTIAILLTAAETADIDPTSVRVVDMISGRELMATSEFVWTGSMVEIFASTVDTLLPGDTARYRVMYLPEESSAYSMITETLVFGIPVWAAVFLGLMLLGVVAGSLYISKKRDKKDLGALLGKFTVALGVIAAFVMLIFALIGG